MDEVAGRIAAGVGRVEVEQVLQVTAVGIDTKDITITICAPAAQAKISVLAVDMNGEEDKNDNKDACWPEKPVSPGSMFHWLRFRVIKELVGKGVSPDIGVIGV